MPVPFTKDNIDTIEYPNKKAMQNGEKSRSIGRKSCSNG
jgi:hypothetical protein